MCARGFHAGTDTDRDSARRVYAIARGLNMRFAGFLIVLFALLSAAGPVNAGECDSHVARWLDPGSGKVLETVELFERLARARVVLLGEAHTTAAHHRWQAYMLAALHSRRPELLVGFEMLPRRAQTVLDAWSEGRLEEREFLEQSNWAGVWGYDADYYLPLFHFLRQNRLPAIALNVDRELVSRVANEGWDELDEDEREGVSKPAPASEAYRESLARLYSYKQLYSSAEPGAEPDYGEIDLDAVLNSDEFANFVAAQLTWDRAMAEALASGLERNPSALVVGIAGRGHLEYGYGIPHQLEDMGVEGVEILLPLDADEQCSILDPGVASAVYVVPADADSAPPRPLLGVGIETADDGVRVNEVVEGSVAERAGIEAGDVILSAAGFQTPTTAKLIEIVGRQAPGTWLPLEVRRDDRELEFVARFPQSFE